MRRRRKRSAEWQQEYYGVSEQELNQLATYNAERMRGIMHTSAWSEQMGQLQHRFNEASMNRISL